jgi:hypothetical protein
MARHRPLEPRDHCAQEDLDRIACIPQHEFDDAALKVIMFYQPATTQPMGWYLSMLKLTREFSDEIADKYGIYGSKTSEVSHMRVMIADRLDVVVRKLLDEQKQKGT